MRLGELAGRWGGGSRGQFYFQCIERMMNFYLRIFFFFFHFFFFQFY